MKKSNGYKIDFSNSTIIMNYKFAAAAKTVGTFEYYTYRSLMRDFPNMKTVVQSGREQKKARYNKRFTYDNMRKYIGTLNNSAKLLADFETVIQKSAPEKSPYKFVCDWFKKTFPDYKNTPIFEDNQVTVSFEKSPDVKEKNVA